MKRFLQFVLLIVMTTVMAFATVTVTPAPTINNIPGTKALNGSGPGFTVLGEIKIVENQNNDFTSGTLTLKAPANWKFDTTGVTIVGATLGVISDTTIGINITNATNSKQTVTINGVGVQAVDGSNTALASIFSSGVAITGISHGTTPFGTIASDGALPVELTSFTNSVKGNKVQLNWATASEYNSAAFEIEKNTTGTWAKIGSVSAAGTTNAPQSYSFTDGTASSAVYRLKMVDRDGKFAYSAETHALVTPVAFGLNQNYPNPFNPGTTITFITSANERATVKVYNLIGQEVAELFNGTANAGQLYTVNFNAAKLTSGTYFYSLKSESRHETKRMMLVK